MVGNFLSAAGHSRSVCEDLSEKFEHSGWSVYRTSTSVNRIHRLADMLMTTWIERENYQVATVDVFSGPAFVWAESVCSLLKILNKPFVLVLHGGNLPEFSKRWPERVRRLLGSASAVVIPSTYLFENLKHLRADLRLIPNPIDLKRYSFRNRRGAQPAVRWLRGFEKIYNSAMAIRVAWNLVGDLQDFRLVMAGSNAGSRDWKDAVQMVSDLELTDFVEVQGRVPKVEVPEWLQHGDVFLNTSQVDNTPISVIEAMACGLCIVSTDVGGIPYLLQDEQDALLVPVNDDLAMAASIKRIVSDHHLAEKLSKNARLKAEQFSWQVVFPQWESLLMQSSRK